MPSQTGNPLYKAVLFDLDGTLVEFKFDVRSSRLAMIAWLHHQGFSTRKMNEQTKTQHIIEQAQEQWDAVGSNSTSFELIKKSLSEILDKFEFEAFREAKPYPGSIPLLQRLSDREIELAIVTNSGRRPVDSILGAFDLSKYMKFVITRNEVSSLKPNPEGILKAIGELGVNKREALYVGDSTIDVEAARGAGVACAAVACGMYRPNVLARSAPEYLVQEIEDVEKILFSEPI